MKKLRVLLAFFLLFLCAATVFAAVAVEDDETYLGEATVIDFAGGTQSFDGSKATVYVAEWAAAGKYRQEEIGLSDFRGLGATLPTINADTWVGNYSSPYLYDTAKYGIGSNRSGVGQDSTPSYIVFPGLGKIRGFTPTNTGMANWVGSPIEYTFRVPDNFKGTAFNFVLKARNSTDSVGPNATGAPCASTNYIAWDMTIQKDGVAQSTVRYDQAPVAVGTASSPNTKWHDVTLTYATPGDIAAGDTVTVRIWRNYTTTTTTVPTGRVIATDGTATQDLYVISAAFRYLANW